MHTQLVMEIDGETGASVCVCVCVCVCACVYALARWLSSAFSSSMCTLERDFDTAFFLLPPPASLPCLPLQIALGTNSSNTARSRILGIQRRHPVALHVGRVTELLSQPPPP